MVNLFVVPLVYQKQLIMSNPVKILRVTAKLDKNGFRFETKEYDCEEKPKTFVSLGGRRIRKDELMVISTYHIEDHKWLRYEMYCLEGDKDKAIDKLRAYITQKIKKIKSEVDELLVHIYEQGIAQ